MRKQNPKDNNAQKAFLVGKQIKEKIPSIYPHVREQKM